jgi:hypothetical protein
MYLDLRPGIFELFEEAALLGKRSPGYRKPPLLAPHEQRVFDNARQARADRRVNRAMRARRPKYEIIPIGVTRTRVCPSCGCVEELRPGMSRWQHMTAYQRCVQLRLAL